MRYFFVLGSNPTLSLAELSAVFGVAENSNVKPTLVGRQNVLVLNIKDQIDATDLIKKIGGTIKIGEIDTELKFELTAILPVLKKYANSIAPAGKFKFGISYYGDKKLNTKVLGMELKKYLKEQGINSRWVTGRDEPLARLQGNATGAVLSSVIVEQNKLTTSGKEFVLLQDGNNLLVGSTLAVQPFKELSFRDYGRPARDDFSGMLPPKLAQIMINLSRRFAPPSPNLERGGGEMTSGFILDPFCGSGTILTEAMLMGYTNLIGSDISPKAVEDTRKNIIWIKKTYNLQPTTFALHNADVNKLNGLIEPNSIDAIITEPYLGPQRGKFDINQTIKELEKLYSESLKIFKSLLKPGGRIVMIWPVFHLAHKTQHVTRNISRLTPDLHDFKIISPLPKQFFSNKNIRLTDRNTIIYGRPGQKVWREIVVLQ